MLLEFKYENYKDMPVMGGLGKDKNNILWIEVVNKDIINIICQELKLLQI